MAKLVTVAQNAWDYIQLSLLCKNTPFMHHNMLLSLRILDFMTQYQVKQSTL
jgi:hypothetical protein